MDKNYKELADQLVDKTLKPCNSFKLENAVKELMEAFARSERSFEEVMRFYLEMRWMMSNQYTMKIYPAGNGRDVYRNIEICGNSTLNQLCQIILESFDFIDEHMYEFCMDNRMYSEYAYQSDPEGDEPSADITLDEVGLCKGQKFALHYDFVDDWMFTIMVSKISEVQGDLKPCIVKAKGSIQQYQD